MHQKTQGHGLGGLDHGGLGGAVLGVPVVAAGLPVVEVSQVFNAEADRGVFGLQLAVIEFVMQIKLQKLQCNFCKNCEKARFLHANFTAVARAQFFGTPTRKLISPISANGS